MKIEGEDSLNVFVYEYVISLVIRVAQSVKRGIRSSMSGTLIQLSTTFM